MEDEFTIENFDEEKALVDGENENENENENEPQDEESTNNVSINTNTTSTLVNNSDSINGWKEERWHQVKDDGEVVVEDCKLVKSGSNASTLSEHSNASKKFSNNLDNSSLTNENDENIENGDETAEIELCPK